ncbi:hypothetical protein A2U01_0087846, partial [Trifolium medium]|nr:hypothetical protein [Trifolium medium]
AQMLDHLVGHLGISFLGRQANYTLTIVLRRP